MIRYWIETERTPRRWWFGFVETYKVCTEFAYQGGFATRKEAHDFAEACDLERLI